MLLLHADGSQRLASSKRKEGIQLIIVNNCKETIWPGMLGTNGVSSPKHGGFQLSSGEQLILQVPDRWSGRVWGRQGCNFDQITGNNGSCQTGDCAGLLQCNGVGGEPPATIVEMTLGTSKSDLHYYDVSLVDGFNVPISMVPVETGKAQCEIAACDIDLNDYCPSALELRKDDKVVGCKSACLATKSDRSCCRGEFANQQSCKPTVFGVVFKAVCPKAYSYAFDDSTGLKTCQASQYVITFCPPTDQ